MKKLYIMKTKLIGKTVNAIGILGSYRDCVITGKLFAIVKNNTAIVEQDGRLIHVDLNTVRAV